MTEKALVKVDTALQKHDDEAFDIAASSTKFLPRIQLMTSNSQKCKDGEFQINNYALVDGQNFIDIGKEVDVIVIAWRPKALDLGDTLIAVYDINDTEFKRIQDEAEEKDSNCMFGHEYLLYLPERSIFVTFFLGNKSARKESPNLKSQMHKGATLKAHQLSNKNYSWWSVLIVPCSSPMDVPDKSSILEEVEKFNDPPATEVEKVAEGESNKRDR